MGCGVDGTDGVDADTPTAACYTFDFVHCDTDWCGDSQANCEACDNAYWTTLTDAPGTCTGRWYVVS
jgi:hypothetical protein